MPARAMGSGLGKNTAWQGDCDISLADRATRERYRLGSLRFGDQVGSSTPVFGAGRLPARPVTVGVVHGDSTVSGHGPGVTPLITGPAAVLKPLLLTDANLACVPSPARA